MSLQRGPGCEKIRTSVSSHDIRVTVTTQRIIEASSKDTEFRRGTPFRGMARLLLYLVLSAAPGRRCGLVDFNGVATFSCVQDRRGRPTVQREALQVRRCRFP